MKTRIGGNPFKVGALVSSVLSVPGGGSAGHHWSDGSECQRALPGNGVPPVIAFANARASASEQSNRTCIDESSQMSNADSDIPGRGRQPSFRDQQLERRGLLFVESGFDRGVAERTAGGEPECRPDRQRPPRCFQPPIQAATASATWFEAWLSAGATVAGVASATGTRASKRLVITAPFAPERAITAS